MKKICILLMLNIFLLSGATAQRFRIEPSERHRLFISIGANNFLGDLGGANYIGSGPFSIRDFDVQSIKPSFQIGYYYRISQFFASRNAFSYFWLSGNDALTKELYRQNRNLNFRSPVYDLSSAFEFVFEYKRKGHHYYLKGINGWKNIRYSSYLYAGVAFSYFRSQGKINGSWYALRPLCTEGEGLVSTRKKYSPLQFSIPLGVGIKVRLSRTIEVSLEYTTRITFTDYLDDVSTTYFDENALLSHGGQLAVNLANPALQKDPSDPLYSSTRPGQQRGDLRNKDSYMAVLLTMYYSFEKKHYISKFKTKNLRFRPRINHVGNLNRATFKKKKNGCNTF